MQIKLNEPLVLDPKLNPHAFFCTGPSLTKQSFQAETDANGIIERFARTGDLGLISKGTPIYADVTNVPDLRTAHETLTEATEWFASLNVKIRNRFDNDPLKLADFLSDSNNRAEAIELGLIAKPVEPVVAPQVDKPA